jgi:hypothetical protein
LVKEIESFALASLWDIDARALSWAILLLDDGYEVELFFVAIPGFYNSALMKNSQKIFLAVTFF